MECHDLSRDLYVDLIDLEELEDLHEFLYAIRKAMGTPDAPLTEMFTDRVVERLAK